MQVQHNEHGDAVNPIVRTFDHGQVNVGATAVQLSATSTLINKVVVKAADGNGSEKIYVGNSDVTANSEVTTDGYQLGAGQSITIPIYNLNLVYVIASAADQKVFYLTY